MNTLVSITFTLFSFHFVISSANLFFNLNRTFPRDNFVRCLCSNSQPHIPMNNVTYAANAPSYSSILRSSLQNLRFNSSTTPKPQYIITPRHISHVKAAVTCSKRRGFEIRVRSGGHDYEGLSYTSPRPFVVLDLVNLRKFTINATDETAWVEAGASVGELYYKVAKKNNKLAFPAGVCPTMGVGGHISGGGRGTLMRKYGLAADNVVDAILIDVEGRVLDRKAMGEDLFWAIRGGGAASFGVILSWRIKLVRVPPRVTVFSITKNLEQGATKLVHRWQNIVEKLHEDLFIRLVISFGNNSRGESTVRAGFKALYLGRIEGLIPLMKSSFPELGLELKDCREMSWLESVLYFHNGYSKNESTKVLLDRNFYGRAFFKAKSDLVTDPILESGLEAIWRRFRNANAGIMIWDPSGGKMSEIPKNETPYPHRAGNLFSIQYYTRWEDGRRKVAKKHMDWINKLYNFMGPFVSKNPRAAYLNYRDIELGRNEYGKESYLAAKAWGNMYFKDNFERLARVKTKVDPENFFKNEQSIPPL